MTEAITQEMTREDFESRHAETGQLIARVGKIWEQVAERQQAIINGKGYLYIGYSTWAEYWSKEWQEASGWSPQTVSHWIAARNIKIETYNAFAPEGKMPGIGDSGRDPLQGWKNWKQLGEIKDPKDRADFLNRYDDEIKPELKSDGVGANVFGEAVKEYKSGRFDGVTERHKEREKEMGEKLHTRPYFSYQEITAAQQAVKNKCLFILNQLRERSLNEDELEMLREQHATVKAAFGLIDSALNGESGTDWDAELEALQKEG